jgi:hypothetical protein
MLEVEVIVELVEVVEVEVEVVRVVVDVEPNVVLPVLVLVDVLKGGVVKVVCDEIPVATTPTLASGPNNAYRENAANKSNMGSGKRRSFCFRRSFLTSETSSEGLGRSNL